MHPNGPLFFYNKIQNFESCTHTTICISLWQIEMVVWVQLSKFCISLYIMNLVSFLKNGEKIENMISRYCLAFLQWKTKLETLLNFELHFIHKKSYKNYRILITNLFNVFFKPVVYCRKNLCKRVNLQFFSVLYTDVSVF